MTDTYLNSYTNYQADLYTFGKLNRLSIKCVKIITIDPLIH